MGCHTGTPKVGGNSMVNACKGAHVWVGTDDATFIAGPNKGSACDVVCLNCSMGALVNSRGEIIASSIAPASCWGDEEQIIDCREWHSSQVLFSLPDALIWRVSALPGFGGAEDSQPFAESGFLCDAQGRTLADDEDCGEPEGDYTLRVECEDDVYTLFFTSPEARDQAASLVRERLKELKEEP